MIKLFKTYHSKRKLLKKKKKVKKLVVKKTTVSAKDKYKAFLKTKYWYSVRKEVLIRDNFTCTKCGSKKKLEVHHKTYKHHHQEHKHLNDLITLCSKCHTALHKTNKMYLNKKPTNK